MSSGYSLSTREKTLRNIGEAIEGYLEVKAEVEGRREKGEKVEAPVEVPPALLA